MLLSSAAPCLCSIYTFLISYAAALSNDRPFNPIEAFFPFAE
uniref:Uncharacterized protein n=1 Tax=Anguilla anguilla TaxID=7936 RepID=A0A0E9PDR3_ANGAN